MNPSPPDNFGPTFQGIQLPQQVTLPDEFIQAYAYMGLAEIKVTLAAIIRFMRVGWAEPITLSEFESLTGLSRKPVLEGIEAALSAGILVRYEVSGYRGHASFVYDFKVAAAPRSAIGGDSPPIEPLVSKLINAVDLNTLKTDLTTTITESSSAAPEMRQKLQESLRKIGVYPNTANHLLSKYAAETIQAFLDIYPEALKTGLASSAGWLVQAIKEGWDLAGIRADLAARQAPRQPQAASPQKLHLPKSVLRDLQTLGWSGALDEVLACYAQDKKRVRAWLEYVLHQHGVYANPPGIFRNGLRSGLMPPKDRHAVPEHYFDPAEADSAPENPPASAEDQQTWAAVMQELQPQVAWQDFNTWVKAARPLYLDAAKGVFTLAVANDFARKWLDTHITALANQALSTVLGREVRVEFLCAV